LILFTHRTKIGVSPQTVQTRYEKMKTEGVILRSTIAVDLSKLGYQGKVLLKITNAPNQNKKKTIDALKQIQDIFLSAEIIGDFDVLAIAAVKDFKSSIDLVTSIRELPSVDHVEVSFTDDTAFPAGNGFTELFQTKKEEPKAKPTS
jgi:DNA-binding Lrp family transcriptional regulator